MENKSTYRTKNNIHFFFSNITAKWSTQEKTLFQHGHSEQESFSEKVELRHIPNYLYQMEHIYIYHIWCNKTKEWNMKFIAHRMECELLALNSDISG